MQNISSKLLPVLISANHIYLQLCSLQHQIDSDTCNEDYRHQQVGTIFWLCACRCYLAMVVQPNQDDQTHFLKINIHQHVNCVRLAS